jgi:S-adenosylmethionine:tRNA ribosyltransferase-isomerase
VENNQFSLDSYLYDLPEDLIAQRPCEPRDASRLMIVDRKSGNFSEIVFKELADFLNSDDTLIFNNTKVLPMRLIGERPTGGKAEVFLIKRVSANEWEALVKPGKKLPVGAKVIFNPQFHCEVVDVKLDGRRIVRLEHPGTIEETLNQYGHIPLPPYMKRESDASYDKERYQTVYAEHPGSAAAPTAGLHFTDALMRKMNDKGIQMNTVTLHVGLGTFLPVKSQDIRDHEMHHETFFISPETAEQLNHRKKTGKQICVGTTTCRTLESAAQKGLIEAGEQETNIFIYPGYQFKYVEHLLTNFHQPGSSLLMLVSAFAGKELIEEAYKKAVKDRYRFLSYGDAMLIL